MTLILVFAMCTMAMTQMPVAHRWLLVMWVTVVMSATTLLADWEPVGTTVPVTTLVYLGMAMVCLTHYLRRRRERLLTEDAGLVIPDFRIADFPRSKVEPLEEEHTERSVRRFLLDTEGQDLIEYALLASFISLVAIAAIINVGTGVNGIWGSVDTQVTTAAAAF